MTAEVVRESGSIVYPTIDLRFPEFSFLDSFARCQRQTRQRGLQLLGSPEPPAQVTSVQHRAP